jgi:hypothetical protein
MGIPITGSIDSLLVAAGMAIAGCPQAYRRQAIFWFMAFDFVATWTGWSFGVSHAAAVLFALALACPVLYAARKRPALYLLLPVLCSADNLLIGAGNEPMQFWTEAGAAIVSGVLAFLGFSLGSLLERRIQGAAQ